MKVKQQCVVAMTWTLSDTLGETLDVCDEAVEFLVGGSDLLAAIEAAMQGMAPGEHKQIQLEPEQAFGDFNEQLIFVESREHFPADVEAGMLFQGLPEACLSEAPEHLLYHVTDVYPEHVVVDGNHPLAGVALRLAFTIHEVREATLDEVGRGTLGAGFFQVPQWDDDPPHLH
jgi:FKBP-type peptidyl-prolyl cis-trans isomerase SlyD